MARNYHDDGDRPGIWSTRYASKGTWLAMLAGFGIAVVSRLAGFSPGEIAGLMILAADAFADLFMKRGSLLFKLPIAAGMAWVLFIIFTQGEHGMDTHIYGPLSHLLH